MVFKEKNHFWKSSIPSIYPTYGPITITYNSTFCAYAGMIYNAGNNVSLFHVEFDFSFSCSGLRCADGFGFIFGPYSFLSTSLFAYDRYESDYAFNEKVQFSEYNYYMYLTGTDGSKQIIYDVILTSLSTSLQHITIDYSINKAMTMTSSLFGTLTAASTINLGSANAFLLGSRTGGATASHIFQNFRLQYTSTPPTSAPSLSPVSKPTLFPTLIPTSKTTSNPTSAPIPNQTLSPTSNFTFI
jgi:hypothetical protein